MVFSGYFIFISDLGLSPYGQTAIANDKEGAPAIIGGIFSLSLVLSFVSMVVLVVFSALLFRDEEIQRNMLIIAAFAPVIRAFGFEYAITALEKNHVFSISVSAGRVVYFLGVYLFVENAKDYMLAMTLFLAGWAVSEIIQSGYIFKKFAGKIRPYFGFGKLKGIFLSAAPYGIVSGLVMLYQGFPVIFLKFLTPDRYVGFYYIANRLIFFIFVFFNLTGSAFIPIIADGVKEDSAKRTPWVMGELIRFAYTASLPVCFGGFAVSGLIISRLFGGGFILSAEAFAVLIWSVFFVSLSSVFSGFLTAVKDKRGLLISSAVTAVLSLFATFVLTLKFGIYGAALSVPLATGAMSFALGFFVLRRLRPGFDALNFVKVVLASSVMALAVKLIHGGLLESVLSGAAIYVIISVLLRTVKKSDLNEAKKILLGSGL